MRRIALPAVLLVLALAPGCGGGSSTEPANSVKIINIENATPASAMPGASTTFNITVSYDLQTA